MYFTRLIHEFNLDIHRYMRETWLNWLQILFVGQHRWSWWKRKKNGEKGPKRRQIKVHGLRCKYSKDDSEKKLSTWRWKDSIEYWKCALEQEEDGKRVEKWKNRIQGPNRHELKDVTTMRSHSGPLHATALVHAGNSRAQTGPSMRPHSFLLCGRIEGKSGEIPSFLFRIQLLW